MGLFAFNRMRKQAAQAQQPVATDTTPESNTAQAQPPGADAPKRGRKKSTPDVKEPDNG